MDAVKKGQMGANCAAAQFGVPKTTLKDRLSGKVGKSGLAPYLKRTEEKELVEFLIHMAKIGYGKTKREVITIVKRTLEKKGLDVKSFNGEGWWTGFNRRHPCLRLRTADLLAMVRSDCARHED